MSSSSDLINVEELISAIQARPAVWMSKHPQYKNKKLNVRLWNEIKSLFPGHEVLQIKKKWKNVKDHYKKEIKKFPPTRSGMAGESVLSTWQYYELMAFLNDDVIPETTGGNLDSENDGNDDNASEDMDSMTDMSLESVATTSSSRRKNKTAREVRDEFLELENKKLKLLESKYDNKKNHDEIEKNDDYHFFISLIPQMKNFNNIQKLKIRNKITKIILDEAEMNAYESRYGSHSRDLTHNTYSYNTGEVDPNYN